MKRATGVKYSGYQINFVWTDNGWRTTVYTADWEPVGDAIESSTLSECTAQAKARINRIITLDALGMATEQQVLESEVMGY